MELHQAFLDEVSSFLESEMLVDGLIPRKSTKEGGLGQLLLADESVPGWKALHPSPVKASIRLAEENRSQNHNSSSSEYDNSPSKKNKHRSDGVDLRQRKYRLRVKGEREELRQLEIELSKQVKEILEARQGTNTTARTDLVLSKSFWKQVAEHQKQRRLHAEKDKDRLLAIVNSQAMYLESLGLTLRECPSWPVSVIVGASSEGCDRLDDRRWLRLKSSDAAVYDIFLQDVKDSYARIDRVFEECEMGSLAIGSACSLRLHHPNGCVKSSQYVTKWLQPFSFEDGCTKLWTLCRLPHRQIDRHEHSDISDPENTIAFKFRVRKTLSCGSTASILKRVVVRRIVESGRVVIVTKVFSEGEGIFSGMDIDETWWSTIRPHSDGSKTRALLQTCTRRVPVKYITANPEGLAVKAFEAMVEEAIKVDEHESIRFLEKL
ncbi:uncharacterized protein IUM83_12517 [Phytophthora cinnamomi]|uniref:uncharacterized protein n=1 Tax=Phytophthora cinnamomi TaxID=4785 RepID=UPI00355A81F4|nr:hypothetical protein IUM83_12517 [Phytophthora cinnamomi]